MNLKKMLETQSVLDDRIIMEKGLEGKDLFANTVLALQVELAEFANEGRWFKHWSIDQKPRMKAVRIPAMMEEDREYYNPLLEEYVDSLHFFLSLANQKGWDEELFIYEEQLEKDYFDGDLTGWYLEMVYFINKSYIEKYSEKDTIAGFQKNAYFFRTAWIMFLNLGINGFGLTCEQIEKAYMDKNAVNHQRQEQGY